MRSSCHTILATLLVAGLGTGLSPLWAQTSPAAPLEGGARRAMTVDDALRLVTVGGPLLSPDGERVLYSARELDWEHNGWTVTYWMDAAAGGEPIRFLAGAGVSDVQWSPDGRWISFRRPVEGSSQVFVMRSNGGEAAQLTRHETSVEAHEWSGDSRYVVFLAPEKRPADEQTEIDAGSDAYFVDEGPNTTDLGVWNNLWRVAVEGDPDGGIEEGSAEGSAEGAPEDRTERISQLELHIYEFEVSPDGQRVLFTARASSDRNDTDLNEIHLLDAADRSVERLTENRAVEDSIHWAPDGRSFSYEADDAREWTHKHDKIWVMDLATREARLVSGALDGGRIAQTWWSPDSRGLYFGVLRRTDTNLFHLDLSSGEIRTLTHDTGNRTVTSLSRDRRRMAYVFSDFDTPPDVFTADLAGGDPVRITTANPWVEEEIALASMEVLRWPSADRLEIEGLLHTPTGYTGTEPLPLILSIHGGPPGFWDNSWQVYTHIYTGLGYALLSPNVRGSAGYSDDFREANTFYRGDGIGFGDFDDLMTGLDHVIQAGVADPDRLGVRGWSYGSILGSYALTRTDRFKGAAFGPGVYDWRAEFGIGYHWDVKRWYIGGTPWTNAEAWENQSTIAHADNITTPVLLFHGLADNTTTEPQSMILFAALKSIGKAPVRYMRFPREGHGFREPRHNRAQLIEEIRWLELHVAGRTWTPPPAAFLP